MTLAVEESGIGAGPVGFVILLLMLVATVLLIRNMSARIKRLPREFPEDDPPTPGDPRGS